MKRFAAAAITCCGLTGCATVNPMAFDKATRSIDTTTKSIVLMAVDVSRSDGSRYVPKPYVVKLEKPNAQSKEDRQNFQVKKDADAVQENGRDTYLVRMAIEPGRYKLADVEGDANAFPFISQFIVPLLLDFEVKPNSIAYVGRVTAKLRPRKDGEFRAGPAIPLIDQAVTGMSTGTWDITVDDRSQGDIALFRATYPALAGVPIARAPLPPFDRAAAQRWWDAQPATGSGGAAAPAPQSAGSK